MVMLKEKSIAVETYCLSIAKVLPIVPAQLSFKMLSSSCSVLWE